MTHTIRTGLPADAAALAAFAARNFREAFAADNRPEDIEFHLAGSFSPEKQRAELLDPTITTLLVEVEGGLAGYAQVRAEAVPPCVGGPGFYVDRPWHGRGIAQALMQAVVDTAARRGAQTLWLGVWERNARARAFYRNEGFVDVGGQDFLLGADTQADRVLALDLARRQPVTSSPPDPPDPGTK